MSCKNQVYIQIGLTNSMWGFLTISDNPNWGGGGGLHHKFWSLNKKSHQFCTRGFAHTL